MGNWGQTYNKGGDTANRGAVASSVIASPPQRSEEYGAERLWETEVVEFSRWRSQWTSVLVPSVKPQNIGIIF